MATNNEKKLLALILSAVLLGCDSGGDTSGIAAQGQPDAATMQLQFEAELRRIEAERKAQAARLAEQRSFVGVRFVSVDEDYLDVELVNTSEKDIDNLAGSLDVLGPDGSFVTTIALMNWVPGDTYLPAGKSTAARKSLQLERPLTKARILAEASDFEYFFTVHRMQYAGEAETSFVEIPAPRAEQATPRPRNFQLANAEPCAAGQLTLETAKERHGWPDCEHVQRNIDSERFKLSYMEMCQRATQSAQLPESTASVRLASCVLDSSGNAIFFTKQICCDLP